MTLPGFHINPGTRPHPHLQQGANQQAENWATFLHFFHTVCEGWTEETWVDSAQKNAFNNEVTHESTVLAC